MKLFSLFRKPAWEHSDSSRRAEAVSSSQDPVLIGKLVDFARHDADASVRRAALARLDDLSLLADRSRLDTDTQVRSFAEKRLRQALVDSKVDLAQRERQVRVLEQVDLLEHVATQAGESSLREEALARIQRKGFLVERCCKDADPALRLKLLARIEEPAALERIAENVRKSDKNLAREARLKSLTLRLSAGDKKAIAQRAEEICEHLQHLVSNRPATARAELAEAEAQWAGLKPAPEANWQGKFQGLTQTLRDELDGVKHAPKPVPVPEPVVDAAAPVAEPAPPTLDPNRYDERLARLLEQAHELSDAGKIESWLKRLDAAQQAIGSLSAHEQTELQRGKALVHATQARLNQEAEALAARQRAVHTDLDAASKAAEAGEAQAALTHFQAAEAKLAELGELAERGLAAKKKRVEQQLAKIKHWQRWSNNEQRVRWCEQIEQLPEQGLHPDALLTRIREAQNAMAKLDELEGLSKDEAQKNGLNRRFRALVSRAIAPAKPYLNQRAEKREQDAQQIQDSLQALSAEAGSADALPALLSVQRRLRDLLDTTRDLEGRERKHKGDAIKAVLDPLKARIDQLSTEGEAAKRKVIAGLRRELVGADPETARRLALDAQEKWKTLPRGKRAVEDALWTELRGLIDPVFEKLREARAEENVRFNTQRQDARSALATLAEAADKLRADPHAAIEHDVNDARGKLDQLDELAREFDRDYRQALRKLEEARATAKLALLHQARIRQKELANLLAHPHDEAARQALWSSLQSDLDSAAKSAWQARLSAPNSTPSAEDLSDLNDLAIQAEMLAGVASPESDKDRRREISMARLAERMGQGEQQNPGAEAIVLWQQWCLSPAFAAGNTNGMNARLESALGRLLGAQS
ncbi:hypothetical protein C7S18_14740 [Ahniella affigens]|uniref:DUF349 domain-containing protein n=1 Tax=Ahniella affigens TaxID=2021234 RepID=A0A2P1PU49_9GAMM|nr:hypothetical protein [Ahniella affigens]AVP98365.1 hypothetical protein C7S18_14740 [Ahniella affigens]